MKIAITGTGYVGLSIATFLSQQRGYNNWIVSEKVALIDDKRSPVKDEYIEKYLLKKISTRLRLFMAKLHIAMLRLS